MIRGTHIGVLLYLVFIFNGCTTMSWQHPIKGQREFSSDKFQCETSSAKLYPAIFVVEQMADGYRTPVESRCQKIKNEVRCTTFGGDYVPPLMATVDANMENRTTNFDSCVQSLGWEMKPVK